MEKLIDLTGKRFGRLTVIERSKSENKMSKWKCKCDCGNDTIVYRNALITGATASCGCLQRDAVSKHGLYNTRLYRIWAHMKERCYNLNYKHFSDYGGRGITVCDEWKNDFAEFYNWAMSNGYSDDLTIDRINNDGNYEPSNCRWVDMNTQENNRRNNHFITINGVTHTVAEWAKIKGISQHTIYARLKIGWSEYDAITKSYDARIRRITNVTGVV